MVVDHHFQDILLEGSNSAHIDMLRFVYKHFRHICADGCKVYNVLHSSSNARDKSSARSLNKLYKIYRKTSQIFLLAVLREA